MYEITLRGIAYERGLEQGRKHGPLVRELQEKCPTWLGALPQERVKEIQDNMVNALKTLCPEMIAELQGISDGIRHAFQ